MLIRWLQITIVLSGLCGSVVCCSIWTENHLIPQGYVGPVVILYGAVPGRDGAAIDHDPAPLVIGEDGVLRIGGAGPREGLVTRKFYYVDSALNRTEIDSSGTMDQLQAFGEQVGNIPEMDIRWVSYFVGVPREFSNLEESRRKAVEAAIGKNGLLEIPSSLNPQL